MLSIILYINKNILYCHLKCPGHVTSTSVLTPEYTYFESVAGVATDVALRVLFKSRGTQSQSSHDGGAARGRTTSLIKSENERWTCEDIILLHINLPSHKPGQTKNKLLSRSYLRRPQTKTILQVYTLTSSSQETKKMRSASIGSVISFVE